MSEWRNHDRFTVVTDGGMKIEVFNHVSVVVPHYVNAVNGHESFQPEIFRGDMNSGPQPDAVTERVSQYLYDEFNINVEERDIHVIDPDDDSIHVQ